MPYETFWIVDKRVIGQKVWGDVTMEELRVMSEEYSQLVSMGIPLMHSIIDTTQVKRHPNLIQATRTLSFPPAERIGWTLLIGTNTVVRFVASVVFQTVNRRFRLFGTVDDALRFLAENDETVAGQLGSPDW